MKCFYTGLTLAALTLGGFAFEASAQSTGALSVDEIRGCTCMDQELATKRTDIDTRRAMLDERSAQLTALSAQISQRRSGLDPMDLVGQEMLKNLINQETALRDLIQSDTRPALNQSVSEYNALAALYTTECANRPRYKVDTDAALKDLTCPMP
jgi:alkylhydroperoxidase/carboxymuconolactone decarboxylase family protein YurZ